MGIHTKQYQWFRREVYPLWSLFPLRGLPLYIRKYQSVFPPVCLSYSIDVSNDTVKCLSPASSYNSPAGGAGFIRCISARRDRETDAGTLYFHWGYQGFPTLRQSTVHFEQRGAGRSPTTLTLSMLHARTLPLLACRNHPLSPNFGRCHSASPD